DRRSKELRVTEAGEARFRAGMKGWVQAQRQFEKTFGSKRTADMRAPSRRCRDRSRLRKKRGRCGFRPSLAFFSSRWGRSPGPMQCRQHPGQGRAGDLLLDVVGR